MSQRLVVGIDPGAEGGVSVVDADTGHLVLSIVMPVSKIKLHAKTKKKKIRNRTEINVVELLQYLAAFDVKAVFIESVHAMPGQGVTSMFSFGFNYGLLMGALRSRNYKIVRVEPYSWKKVVLAGCDCSVKYTSINKARELTDFDFLATERCRVGHDGMAESYLIAYYGVHYYQEDADSE